MFVLFLYISTPSKREQGKFLGTILSSRRRSATDVFPKRYILSVKGPPVYLTNHIVGFSDLRVPIEQKSVSKHKARSLGV